MLLVDVNLLIHAANRDSPDHAKARAWWLGLEQAGQMVGLSWMTLVAFVRLSTNAKVLTKPLPLADALEAMHRLLAQANVMIVHPGVTHAAEFDRACREVHAVSNLVTDAHLAALLEGKCGEVCIRDQI